MRPAFAAALFQLLTACAGTPPPSATASRPFLVFFQEWSGAIDDSALVTVAAAAERARAMPAARVVITAFADPGGSAEANADITRLRARLISDRLESLGVAPARIDRRAMGAVAPIGGPQESRRAEIVIAP